MSLTYGQVRTWRAAPLETAGEDTSAHIETITSLQSDLEATRVPGWTGYAADAAERERATLQDQLEVVAARLGATRRAFFDTADAVTGVEHAVREVDALALAHQFDISGTGVVTDVAGAVILDPEHVDEYHEDRVRRRDEVVARVGATLRKATDVDADLVAALGAISRLDDLDASSVSEAVSSGAQSDPTSTLAPPLNGSPADNSAWWDALSPAEQAEMIATHPQLVGSLDGVEAWARDKANRSILGSEIERIEGELADAEQALRDEWFDGLFSNTDAKVDELRAKLESLRAIDVNLARDSDDPALRRSLLELDLSKDRAEAAVGIGDLDRADHVAVFTPGLDSTVNGSLTGYDNDMRQMLDEAARQQLAANGGDGDTVAGVTWLAYQAPQMNLHDIVVSDTSVTSDHAARDGGAELEDFLRGLDTSRDTDPHLTALGHSYGSVTTAYALKESTGVDDAVFFGSPGLATSDSDDIRTTSGSFYVLEAKNDAVADFAYFGTDPTWLDGATQASTSESVSPDGRALAESTGHSQYFDAQTTSQYNIAAVVGGREDQLVTGANHGVGEVFTWTPFHD